MSESISMKSLKQVINKSELIIVSRLQYTWNEELLYLGNIRDRGIKFSLLKNANLEKISIEVMTTLGNYG